MLHVFISASTQSKNIGVGNYGTEESQMHRLADKVAILLNGTDQIIAYRNNMGSTLRDTGSLILNANSRNKLALVVDNHTNAGPKEQIVDGKGAEGTEVLYKANHFKSQQLAQALYTEISVVSLGGDRGTKPRDDLYIMNVSTVPTALVEHFFHTNLAEVSAFDSIIDKLALAEARAICKILGVDIALLECNTLATEVDAMVRSLSKRGAITNESLWADILLGKKLPDPAWLRLLVSRLLTP